MQTLRARPVRVVIVFALALMLIGGAACAAGKVPAQTDAPPAEATLPGTTPDPSTAPPTATAAPCIESHELQICVLSATQSAGKTMIVVAAKSLGGQLTPGSEFPGQLLWQDEKSAPTLVDAQGRALPLETGGPDAVGIVPVGGSSVRLTFSGIPADGQPVKLSIPGFYASMPVDQTVSVDLGKDPQPGTLAVDSDIQAFGQTVRFRSGTMLGDGTSSLRLYLKSEPVTIQDGVEPYALEMGRPERVDDLYGAGPLTGKGLFVELFQYGKKLSGMLDLPIVKATAVIHGPFEFSLAVLPGAPETSTPTAAPAPTGTPLSLAGYAYGGGVLSSGDLLYGVFADGNTHVYAFTTGADRQPRLFVTLPGAVAQMYLHPDHLGMDYLAGAQASSDDIHYIDYVRLYTLRFADPAPRLLYSFPPNSENFAGTAVAGDWSFDGRYAIFSARATISNSSFVSTSVQYVWFDLSCRADVNCIPHTITVQPNLDIYNPHFAPADYRVLFAGSDSAGTGKPDLFLLDFDPQKPDNQVRNLTTQLFISDSAYDSLWTSDKKIFTVCYNGATTETNAFCTIDPVTGGVITPGKPISARMGGYRLFEGYWLAPSEKQLAAITFPENGTRESIPELHLLGLDGQIGALIAGSQSLVSNFNAAFSPSGKYFGYLFENGQTLEIFDTASGQNIPVNHAGQAWTLAWLGWVR